MSEFTRIGVDTSKAVFTLHGIDAAERPVLRTNLRRAQMIPLFRKIPPIRCLPRSLPARNAFPVAPRPHRWLPRRCDRSCRV